jgi:hypothetical protein
VNQRTSAESVALLTPPVLQPVGDLNFSPAPGLYHAGSAGYLQVDITAPSSPPIYYRTDTDQPWVPYDPAKPPRISASTTFFAFANTMPPGRIQTAAYTITAASAITLPPSIDANHNGLPDDWEQTFGVSDPNGDLDGDGFTNLQEYLAGTDPLDPGSTPGNASGNVQLTARLPGPSAPANAICEIAWPADATGYLLETTADLNAPWVPASNGTITSGTEQIYFSLPDPTNSRAFFRLRRQP